MRIKGLGVSLFVHNAIEFDYCVAESIASMIDLCEEMVVLDCESTDGTTELLQNYLAGYKHVKFIKDVKWEVGTKYERLPILANLAKSHLNTPWHFMLQADEVFHEAGTQWLNHIVSKDGAGFDAHGVTRINFYGDPDHHVSFTSTRKPCGDFVYRLARTCLIAHGDAENIDFTGWAYSNQQSPMMLCHYGFVRDGISLLKKAKDMQTWFWGSPKAVDERVLRMLEEGKFKPHEIIDPSEYVEFQGTHPKVALRYVEKLRAKHG